MNAKDVIRNTLDLSDHVFGAYLNDLDDSDLFVRPVPGMNHIAWQVGHLIATEHRSIELLRPGTSPALPEGFEDVHGKDGARSDDRAKFLTRDGYLALWKAQREGRAGNAAMLERIAHVPQAKWLAGNSVRREPFRIVRTYVSNMLATQWGGPNCQTRYSGSGGAGDPYVGNYPVFAIRQLEHEAVAVRLPQAGDGEEAHATPASSRRRIRAVSQSHSRARGTVIAMKKQATTTYGV